MSLIGGGGLGLMIGLAVLIGQRRAQDAAWRHIAAERSELNEWERGLIAAAEGRGCPGCHLRHEDDER